MQERDLLQALRSNKALVGNRDLRIRGLREASGFDAAFELETGGNKVKILVEAEVRCTAASIARIAPWIRRTKALLPGASVAVLCESLPLATQEFCIDNDIDFIDLTGNVSINVPGVLLIRRTGRPRMPRRSAAGTAIQNPFSSRSSRVIRVLLEQPRAWRGSTIAEELLRESRDNILLGRNQNTPIEDERSFVVDAGSISRVIRRLEEDLLVRRRGSEIVVAEPERLLRRWAERYEERYRWRLRRSFLINNPFGLTTEEVAERLPSVRYAFTGVAAATAKAPYVDAETFDLFVATTEESTSFRKISGRSSGPRLRIILPYDAGVFMYARVEREIPMVSPIQCYLDAYASGGRDRKQAEYLLESVIIPKWEEK